MQSPSHRTNVLSPTMEYIGVGTKRDGDGRIYATQVFANGSDPSY